MQRIFPAVLIFCIGSFVLPLYGGQEGAPPQELLEYVREASKLGLKETQIRQNAVQAGWPLAAVNQALTRAQHEATTGAAGANHPPAASATPPSAPVSAVPARESATSAAGGAGAVPKTAATAPEIPESSKTRGVPDDYVIGAGDVLQISVWKEPDASIPNVVVRPDGKISIPILKEIEVVGLTPTQLEKLITERLSRFIPAADVTVVVTGINSKKIYVLGAVKKEGPLPYTYRMTIMQALSEAGGLTDYAKRKKIYVLRMENGKEYRLPFDYNAALKGEHMEMNIPLMPGDTLVVPQ